MAVARGRGAGPGCSASLWSGAEPLPPTLSVDEAQARTEGTHCCNHPPTPSLAHPIAQLALTAAALLARMHACTYMHIHIHARARACTSRPQLFSRRASLKLQLEGCGELKHKTIKHRLEAHRGAHVEAQPLPRASLALVAVDT